jgi:hypothetical protein
VLFWSVVGCFAFWVLIYLSLLLGFVLHPRKNRSGRPPAISAIGHATAIWVLCVGDFYLGALFAVLLIAISLALALFLGRISVRRAT